MSAEIPGTKPEFRSATIPVTDLVTKIMIATGWEVSESEMYGQRIGSYAGEIVLAALNKSGLLSTDFTTEKLEESVRGIDAEMNLDEWVAEVKAKKRMQ